MRDGRRKVPSKTFHLGPGFEDALLDLFESHLQLASLLEASTSIVAGGPQLGRLASPAIAEADQRWVSFWRNYWKDLSEFSL
jgi:hypothetical protein